MNTESDRLIASHVVPDYVLDHRFAHEVVYKPHSFYGRETILNVCCGDRARGQATGFVFLTTYEEVTGQLIEKIEEQVMVSVNSLMLPFDPTIILRCLTN